MSAASADNSGSKVRAHLVLGEKENEPNSGLIKVISQYCMITGWSSSLDEAAVWAEKGGGEDPDLILINSAVYFLAPDKLRKPRTKDFLRLILTMKKCRLKSRIILLLSENMLLNRELIINLLKMQIYNLWFLDSFDEDDVRDFLRTDRTIEDVEKYLELKDKELAYYRSLRGDGANSTVLPKDGEKLFKPYHVQSNIITFWSENDTCLNYGMAILTALNLARHGFKVLLGETISAVPCLAGCLAIEHPYFNMSHALAMFMQGNHDFMKNCFYNGEKYLNDPYALSREESKDFLEFLPSGLYFLPDGKREDSPCETVPQEQWAAFLTQLSRIIMFEKGFHFLIFVGSGRNRFNQQVLEEFTYTKFITVDLLPASILYGIKEREKGEGRTKIIGTKAVTKINKEIKGMGEEPFLYPPASFVDDFLQFVYTRNYRKITTETEAFVDMLMEAVGVKITSPDVEPKGVVDWLRVHLK
ncbi:MAG: hypothetical protein ACOX2X_08880 [Peptococcia bacterium]|jgi:hypothetical protein